LRRPPERGASGRPAVALDNLLLLDHLPENAKLGDKAVETYGEIINSFTFLETDALELRLSRCALTFRTASLPIRKDLTASHASAAVAFTASDGSISYGTALVMASNAIQSSCSVTSPGSIASQRFLACSLIFMINVHSV
jgi:hypothetical protein